MAGGVRGRAWDTFVGLKKHLGPLLGALGALGTLLVLQLCVPLTLLRWVFGSAVRTRVFRRLQHALAVRDHDSVRKWGVFLDCVRPVDLQKLVWEAAQAGQEPAAASAFLDTLRWHGLLKPEPLLRVAALNKWYAGWRAALEDDHQGQLAHLALAFAVHFDPGLLVAGPGQALGLPFALHMSTARALQACNNSVDEMCCETRIVRGGGLALYFGNGHEMLRAYVAQVAVENQRWTRLRQGWVTAAVVNVSPSKPPLTLARVQHLFRCIVQDVS